MVTSMLGDFSARSVGISLADFVYLQQRSHSRGVRRRRSERRAATATTSRAAGRRFGPGATDDGAVQRLL